MTCLRLLCITTTLEAMGEVDEAPPTRVVPEDQSARIRVRADIRVDARP
jgi:hypothetical protein